MVVRILPGSSNGYRDGYTHVDADVERFMGSHMYRDQ